MSNKRISREVFLNRNFDVVPGAFDLPHRHQIPEHHHSRDQLVYACAGVMTVITADGTWVVPPNRAVWVPAGVRHRLRMSGQVEMRTLYLRKRLASSLPRNCCVVSVPPLLREVIRHITEVGPLSRRLPASRRLLEFLLDRLRELSTVRLHANWPTDPRARKVAELVATDPASRATLDELAHRAGAAKRTIERFFIAQTGLSFREWRRQLRLLKSLELLAAGKDVTTTALDVGYESTSAFIAAFRESLGTTPRQYFRNTART